MPVPDFIVRLREKIGSDPLWLIGCTAVVVRPHSDNALSETDAFAATAASGSMRDPSAPVVGGQGTLDIHEPWSAQAPGTPEQDVLLVRRSDDRLWAPVTGIVDPGEHPARAAVREAYEETQVECEIERLAEVHVTDEVRYRNGDVTQYTGIVFRCRYVSGEPAVGDDESVAASWWRASTLPPMRKVHRNAIRAALREEPLAELRDTDGSTIPVGVATWNS